MKALVTGGGGFLGRAIVEALLAEGHAVTSMSRGSYPELEVLGATTVQADLGDPVQVREAIQGHDTVFHVASLTGIFGKRSDFERTNVTGTENVLQACLDTGAERLIYTSSPSVCFDGSDHLKAKNDLPLAERFVCDYPRTKAQAERLVLAANGPRLAVTVLRPHLIFGPRDPHLIPRILERARAGRLVRIGKGTNEVSMTFVDNAAAAHLDAACTLAPGAPHAGRAYFISQEEPVLLWPWIDELLVSQGIPPIKRSLPLPLAYGLGAGLEFAWRVLRRSGEPPMTRFVAMQLASSHSYDMAPARDDFGYTERVSLARAMELLHASL